MLEALDGLADELAVGEARVSECAALRELPLLSPRPPLRKKGGGPGSHAASESGEVAAPPFRSQSDRRQWLLQEKRRWLGEMRLGGGGNPAEASIPAPTPSKLPPIPAGGAALSNGIDLATIATPR